MLILNSAYTTGNANKAILEFLSFLRTNNIETLFQTSLMKEVKEAVETVRNDKGREMAYMTVAMKMDDIRRRSLDEGRAEGIIEGMAIGEEKGIVKGIAKGIAKGRAEGIMKGQETMLQNIVQNMLHAMSVIEIANLLKQPKEQIQAIADRLREQSL